MLFVDGWQRSASGGVIEPCVRAGAQGHAERADGARDASSTSTPQCTRARTGAKLTVHAEATVDILLNQPRPGGPEAADDAAGRHARRPCARRQLVQLRAHAPRSTAQEARLPAVRLLGLRMMAAQRVRALSDNGRAWQRERCGMHQAATWQQRACSSEHAHPCRHPPRLPGTRAPGAPLAPGGAAHTWPPSSRLHTARSMLKRAASASAGAACMRATRRGCAPHLHKIIIITTTITIITIIKIVITITTIILTLVIIITSRTQ